MHFKESVKAALIQCYLEAVAEDPDAGTATLPLDTDPFWQSAFNSLVSEQNGVRGRKRSLSSDVGQRSHVKQPRLDEAGILDEAAIPDEVAFSDEAGVPKDAGTPNEADTPNDAGIPNEAGIRNVSLAARRISIAALVNEDSRSDVESEEPMTPRILSDHLHAQSEVDETLAQEDDSASRIEDHPDTVSQVAALPSNSSADSGLLVSPGDDVTMVACPWPGCIVLAEVSSGKISKHIMAHIVERNAGLQVADFSCPYEGCDTKCSDKRALERHLRSNQHLKLKLLCTICDATISRKDAFKRHMDTQHGAGKDTGGGKGKGKGKGKTSGRKRENDTQEGEQGRAPSI
ncbi:hypothetical protein PUNSTDRAFT_138370 [Punctularia strigosozonata HHB-11173 SS5]|uniref:C2H2-type domain-containing protein n=1 Tax=Punctularia strigosozonata (strain HHB-11173) TaxID=741275 RepID=R7S2Y8_PUNST|nr:uncharacterized protein PUNSTDRAFT_138370 [Punctularia strigosozonata HHB-11173 SS5]EIN04725.1 hypothetical protein PUNSTDRAFT_138370 [Punctularia strigosozonata HHB-11173 SS5]